MHIKKEERESSKRYLYVNLEDSGLILGLLCSHFLLFVSLSYSNLVSVRKYHEGIFCHFN